MDPATKLHVIYVCVLFVTALMGFANAYYDLYRKDARHFLFNADILKRQKEAVQLELETDQARCRLNILHLQELVNALVKREFTTLPESAPGQVILRSGRRYEFRCTSGAPPAVPTTSVWMYDEDGQGAVIGMLAFRTYGDPVREDSFLEIAREASVEESSARRS